MKLIHYLYYIVKNRIIYKRIDNDRLSYVGKLIGKYRIQDIDDGQDILSDLIKSGKPFFAGRIGMTEHACMLKYEFGIKYHIEENHNQMCMWSGFFPNKAEEFQKFVDLQRSSLSNIDVYALLGSDGEEYFIKKYGSHNLNVVIYESFLPWITTKTQPWTKALEGKKVLVVHPFSDTIKSQYSKRSKLFEGTQILPEFNLQTYRAVQTIAYNKDSRFDSWMGALESMKNDISKMDFDIALLGCGAYGFPLAAEIKKMGKQAIHMGGSLQILFGIMGGRWKDNAFVMKYYNDDWVYPAKSDRPDNFEAVENGCYW